MNRRRAFTIIELATVLAMTALIIGATVGAYLGWQRSASIRGAEDQVYSALVRARSFAITHRVTTGLALGVTNAPNYPARGYFYIFTNDLGVAAEDAPPPSTEDLPPYTRVKVSAVSWLPLRTTLAAGTTLPLQTLLAADDPYVVSFLTDGRTQEGLDDDPVRVAVGVTHGKLDNATTTWRGFELDPLTGLPRSREVEP